MDALIELIGDIEAAGTANKPGLGEARRSQRRAQFFLDFVESENSMGFHAPQESMRILAMSI